MRSAWCVCCAHERVAAWLLRAIAWCGMDQAAARCDLWPSGHDILRLADLVEACTEALCRHRGHGEGEEAVGAREETPGRVRLPGRSFWVRTASLRSLNGGRWAPHLHVRWNVRWSVTASFAPVVALGGALRRKEESVRQDSLRAEGRRMAFLSKTCEYRLNCNWESNCCGGEECGNTLRASWEQNVRAMLVVPVSLCLRGVRVFEREREPSRVSGERACCIEAMQQSGCVRV